MLSSKHLLNEVRYNFSFCYFHFSKVQTNTDFLIKGSPTMFDVHTAQMLPLSPGAQSLLAYSNLRFSILLSQRHR